MGALFSFEGRVFSRNRAVLSSHPDFLLMAPRDKILTLLKYTQRNVPWTKAAQSAENAGLSTFSDIVCAGAGVCRHNSNLLATTLSEAGFPTRLVRYLPEGQDGHAWMEVDMRMLDGSVQTYVVDPSNG